MRRICGILGAILLVFLIAQPAAGAAAPDAGVGTAVPSLMLEAGGSTGTHAFVAPLAGVTPEKRVQAPFGGQNRWLVADDGGNGGDDDGGGEDFDDESDWEDSDNDLDSPRTGLAHVVSGWDWHLVNGEKKRKLHWCLIPAPLPDGFPRDQVAQWTSWARDAFANWVKDGKGKPTGWTFEEVSYLDPNCQVLIRFSTRPNGSYGIASVPTGEKGDQRAKKVTIRIFGVGLDKKPRKYGRKGKDTLDPVRILKHEIGHAIRLDDTKNKKDIMSSGVETEAGEIGNHDTTPSDGDYKGAGKSASTGL